MKINILHVVYSLEIGGLERVVISLCNNLPPAIYNSYICCISDTGELSSQFNFPDRLFNLNNQGRINLNTILALGRIVKTRSIDLIHSHNLPGLLYSYPICKLLRIPIIHTEHGYIDKKHNKILKITEKLMSRSVDKYVCVSKQLEKLIQGMFHIDERKLITIYNGITLDTSQPSRMHTDTNNIVIGSIGRLTQIKNYELLINSFSSLVKQYPHIELLIVGDGEHRDNLVNLIKSLSLEDKIVLPGFQLNLDEYFDKMDVFVLPSFSEGHSIALLEALNKRLVCVASNVGGNPEIITNGVNGYLFESNNLDELTSILARTIENIHTLEANKMREMGHNSIRDRFSLDIMLDNYEKLYIDKLKP